VCWWGGLCVSLSLFYLFLRPLKVSQRRHTCDTKCSPFVLQFCSKMLFSLLIFSPHDSFENMYNVFVVTFYLKWSLIFHSSIWGQPWMMSHKQCDIICERPRFALSNIYLLFLCQKYQSLNSLANICKLLFVSTFIRLKLFYFGLL